MIQVNIALKIFGFTSILCGLLALSMAFASLFDVAFFEQNSQWLPKSIYLGIIAILGGVTVLKRNIFGKWLFFFVGLFGILRLIINLPLNIFYLSKIPSEYPHSYEYPWFWMLNILHLSVYIFLITFFSRPGIMNEFKKELHEQ